MNLNSYRPPHAIEGPAFPPGFRNIATALVALVLAAGAKALLSLPDATIAAIDGRVKILVACAVLLVLYTTYWFHASRIRIDETGMTQTWLFNKRIVWVDVVSSRMIAIPGVEFIFPPRLVVSSGFGRFKAFNGGNPDIWQEFARIHVHFRKNKRQPEAQ